MHVEAGAAAPIGDKSDQFGWGGTGVVSPELSLNRMVGLEISLGAVVLSDQEGGDPPGVAPTGVGLAGIATAGPRLRPLALLAAGNGSALDWDGLWLSGGMGAGLTGGDVRPVIRTSLGWDALTEDFAMGPFVGFTQMVEPNAESLRPEDARMAVFGLHGSLAPAQRRGSGAPAPPPPSPKLDSDGDGILDEVDKCPQVAEDRDAFEDDDGCPEADNDQDGVLDIADLCPLVAEDLDGFEDDNGCPELDDDQDGVPDAVDQCPRDPETKNGLRDEDGCPDTEDLHVAGNEIVLDERVHFATGLAEVSVKSWPLLARVAEFLNAHPEYAVIHVSGHADDRGTEDFNQRLSEARAKAVRDLLIRSGVTASRLVVEAHGKSAPRKVGIDDEARRENRRVEFEILERAASKKGSAP